MTTSTSGPALSRMLLDVGEVAEELAISRRSVQALVYSGALASVKIGRTRRVARVDLEDFVQRLRLENEDARPRLGVVGGTGGRTPS